MTATPLTNAYRNLCVQTAQKMRFEKVFCVTEIEFYDILLFSVHKKDEKPLNGFLCVNSKQAKFLTYLLNITHLKSAWVVAENNAGVKKCLKFL